MLVVVVAVVVVETLPKFFKPMGVTNTYPSFQLFGSVYRVVRWKSEKFKGVSSVSLTLEEVQESGEGEGGYSCSVLTQ